MDLSSLREPRSNHAPMGVYELNEYIKSLLDHDRQLAAVSVRGEISNFTAHSGGHMYFTLKDEGGQLRAVMFRSSAARLVFRPEDGMKVIATGSVSVYSKGGAYQLYVTSLQPDGLGALYFAYEQLKGKLQAEGLFAPEHKKPIPTLPRSIGVITSPTGAAVRDIIHVTGRRFPKAAIYLAPAVVQGEGAVPSLLQALELFEHHHSVDVIILGRGGGSMEDLWAFNDERLARKIHQMSIPIISAVGHETDFTICDFVSDLRAPTPSAAAELCVPDVRELLYHIDHLCRRADAGMQASLSMWNAKLAQLQSSAALSKADGFLLPYMQRVEQCQRRAEDCMDRRLATHERTLALLAGKLQALSPLAVLSRGYSVVQKNSAVIRSVREVAAGDPVSLRVADGIIHAEVKKTEKPI